MGAKYQINIFGKTGCDKTKMLTRRVEKILEQKADADLCQVYSDIETVEGIVAIAEARCINPKRIPALLVSEWNDAASEYTPIPVAEPGVPDPVCKGARLFQYAGLQTDYSKQGKGILTPAMIETVLSEATT